MNTKVWYLPYLEGVYHSKCYHNTHHYHVANVLGEDDEKKEFYTKCWNTIARISKITSLHPCASKDIYQLRTEIGNRNYADDMKIEKEDLGLFIKGNSKWASW